MKSNIRAIIGIVIVVAAYHTMHANIFDDIEHFGSEAIDYSKQAGNIIYKQAIDPAVQQAQEHGLNVLISAGQGAVGGALNGLITGGPITAVIGAGAGAAAGAAVGIFNEATQGRVNSVGGSIGIGTVGGLITSSVEGLLTGGFGGAATAAALGGATGAGFAGISKVMPNSTAGQIGLMALETGMGGALGGGLAGGTGKQALTQAIKGATVAGGLGGGIGALQQTGAISQDSLAGQIGSSALQGVATFGSEGFAKGQGLKGSLKGFAKGAAGGGAQGVAYQYLDTQRTEGQGGMPNLTAKDLAEGAAGGFTISQWGNVTISPEKIHAIEQQLGTKLSPDTIRTAEKQLTDQVISQRTDNIKDWIKQQGLAVATTARKSGITLSPDGRVVFNPAAVNSVAQQGFTLSPDGRVKIPASSISQLEQAGGVKLSPEVVRQLENQLYNQTTSSLADALNRDPKLKATVSAAQKSLLEKQRKEAAANQAKIDKLEATRKKAEADKIAAIQAKAKKETADAYFKQRAQLKAAQDTKLAQDKAAITDYKAGLDEKSKAAKADALKEAIKGAEARAHFDKFGRRIYDQNTIKQRTQEILQAEGLAQPTPTAAKSVKTQTGSISKKEVSAPGKSTSVKAQVVPAKTPPTKTTSAPTNSRATSPTTKPQAQLVKPSPTHVTQESRPAHIQTSRPVVAPVHRVNTPPVRVFHAPPRSH